MSGEVHANVLWVLVITWKRKGLVIMAQAVPVGRESENLESLYT